MVNAAENLLIGSIISKMTQSKVVRIPGKGHSATKSQNGKFLASFLAQLKL
jgi:hypothetical protein